MLAIWEIGFGIYGNSITFIFFSKYKIIIKLKVFFFFKVFIYLFMAVLGLRFCARAFCSCGKRRPLFIAVRRLLTIGFSLSRPLLLRSTGSRHAGSVVVAHGPSCSVARGIFPDQGSNPCPLYWQANSQPLRHQGNPKGLFLKVTISSLTYHLPNCKEPDISGCPKYES